jgi:hypothetical protein
MLGQFTSGTVILPARHLSLQDKLCVPTLQLLCQPKTQSDFNGTSVCYIWPTGRIQFILFQKSMFGDIASM